MPQNHSYGASYYSNYLGFNSLDTKIRQFSAYLGACF
jgi:hypothetical protein